MADHTIWGSFDGALTQYIRPYIEVNWEQNQGQNTSTVTATLYFHRYTSNYWTYNELTNSNGHSCTFRVGGSTLTQIRPFNLQRSNPPNRVSIWARTQTIEHNSNGTATVNISANGSTNVNPNTYSFGESVTLPTIPRQTTISEVSMRNGLNPTTFNALDISIDRKHSSYTHEFEILAGSTSLHSSTGGAVSSVTIPVEDVRKMIDRMPTVTRRNFTFRVTTKSGNTVIGRETMNFGVFLNIPSTRPTIDSTWVSRLGSGHDSTISKYVQNISRVRLQFEADYGRGATRQSQTIKINGRVYDGSLLSDGVTYRVDTEPLNLTGTVTIEYIATNSRGQESEPYTRPITFHEYKPPAIQEFTMVRSEINPTNIIASRRYTRTSLDGDNTPTTGVIERQAFGSNTWQEVNDSNLLSLSATITGNSESTSYIFRTTVTDRFGNSATAEVSVGTARVLMEKYKDTGISVGQRFDPNNSAVFQVGGDVSLRDEQNRTLNLLNPTFIKATLVNNWKQASLSGYGDVGYYKVGGVVYLSGLITHDAIVWRETIFTLPEGFRPHDFTRFAPTSNHSASLTILISPGGIVRFETSNISSVSWLSLSEISFPVGG